MNWLNDKEKNVHVLPIPFTVYGCWDATTSVRSKEVDQNIARICYHLAGLRKRGLEKILCVIQQDKNICQT